MEGNHQSGGCRPGDGPRSAHNWSARVGSLRCRVAAERPDRVHPWRDRAAAERFEDESTVPDDARLRRVRVVCDYSMFDRREAPQYYADAIARHALFDLLLATLDLASREVVVATVHF